MITGNPFVDKELQISKYIKKDHSELTNYSSVDIITKLKNANRTEKEFLIFKAFFNDLTKETKEHLMYEIKAHPFFLNKLWWLIDEATDARKYSKCAIYNRNQCCIEIMTIYKSLLEKMSTLAKELNINNSLELSILFSYLLWNGYLSKEKILEYKENNDHEIVGLLFLNIINGTGVCRNYSEMLKDFLNYCGYKSVILANYLSDNIQIDYRMEINKKYGYTNSNEDMFKRKKANHAFNLIEDNGLYIYDPTNLLWYFLENVNSSILVNGKGKSIIYPYRSYDFCYSKDDEKLLDRLFSDEKFVPPYHKADFISTSEVNLELIKNSTSLLNDFYNEARSDLVNISSESNQIMTRKRII